MTLSEIKQVLAERNLCPLKQLGQNFLFDGNLCRFIVDSLPAKKGDRVLEIGPGLGMLTELMLKKGWNVTAMELDKGFCEYLNGKFGKRSNFHLVEGDAVEMVSLEEKVHWVIGNLPYNVSTPLLIEILKLDNLPEECVFTLQREMGDRLLADARTKEYGSVSVFVQNFYEVEILKALGRNVFYPEPNVDSVIVKLVKKKGVKMSSMEREGFYYFIRQGFTQRRKMLGKKLGNKMKARAEELSPKEWLKLYKSI